MAQLDKVGAIKLRQSILADCNAGLRPRDLCERCQTYDLQEWIFPQKTDGDLDCIGVPLSQYGHRVHLSWGSLFSNFYKCAFCNLVLLGLASDPNFDRLEFSADLSWVDFMLVLTGTVVTDKASEVDADETLRLSGWLERDKDTLCRPVRHIRIRGVGGKTSACSDWFPLGAFPETKNTLLCFRPIMSDQGLIYLETPKRWYNICYKEHDEQCRPNPLDQMGDTEMYMINVEDRCVVSVEPPVYYFALSYCWGDTTARQFLKLKSSTKAELSRQGALSEAHPLVPTTIQDAIAFTRAFGCRYLWVDALCILQDSEEHKQAQIDRMDKIYQGAYLTIVAGYGKDAWAGLPGVNQASSQRQHFARKVKDIVLSSRSLWKQPTSYANESRWSSRAWTLQERVLSKRLLVFTEFGMLWECAHDVWEEGIIAESAIHAGTRIEGLKHIKPPDTLNPFQKYAWLMEAASEKNLSFPGDKLRCIQGMLNQLKPDFPGGFFWGMAVAILGSCLLFDQSLWSGVPYNRCEHFPSWCWAGWMEPVKYHIVGSYDSGFSSRNEDISEVYNRFPAEPIWARQEVAFFRIDETSKEWQELLAVQISDKDSAFYNQSKAKWDSCGGHEVTTEIMSRLVSASVSPSRVLGFWTQTVFLSVDRFNPWDPDPNKRSLWNSFFDKGYVIRDQAKRAIGSIKLSREYRGRTPDRLRFILIGQNRRWEQEMGILLNLLHVEVIDDITYRVGGIRDSMVRLETWPLLEPRWEFIVMA